MKKIHYILLCFGGLIASAIVLFPLAYAQEEIYRIEHTDVFGKLRRPAIDFAHDTHVIAMDEEGCGACHHAPDEKTGELIYVEDEEVSCSECHGQRSEDDIPALREAFHASCTPCHRQMGSLSTEAAGPTTCGECHVPE